MKKINKTKKILIAEGAFVLVALMYIFLSNAPNQLYPLHGMTISDPDFTFEIQNGEQIILSFDEDFTNPILLTEDSDITLPPGTYYWKVKSRFRESEIMNFTIQSHVGLNIHENEENYELENSGNVGLNVTKENKGITSEIILEIDEFKIVEKDNSTYEGKQK